MAVIYSSSLGRLCLLPVCVRITVFVGYWHLSVGYSHVVVYHPYMCANKFVNLTCPISLAFNFKCYS